MLNRTIPVGVVRDTLTTQLRFYFPEIESIAFGDGTVEVELASPVAVFRLEKAIDRILARFARIPQGIAPRVLLDTRDARSVAAWGERAERFPEKVWHAAVEDLVDALRAFPAGARSRVVPGRALAENKGLNIYSTEAIGLFTLLDQFLARCLTLGFGAETISAPSMIPASVVGKAGYFDTGSQHLSFVAPVSNDPEVFDAFLPFWAKATEETGDCADPRVHDYLKLPRNLLNPAICLHAYPLFAGQTVPSDEPVFLTLIGSCFRDESGNLNNDERLYEFRVREGVIVGGAREQGRVHGELLHLLGSVGLLLGLDFALETATDMFFNEGAGQQLFSQLVSDSKIEIAARSAGLGRRVSSASLNKHGNHFSKAFEITDEQGLLAPTMCVGFGLDRLTYLVWEQYEGDLDRLARDVETRVSEA